MFSCLLSSTTPSDENCQQHQHHLHFQQQQQQQPDFINGIGASTTVPGALQRLSQAVGSYESVAGSPAPAVVPCSPCSTAVVTSLQPASQPLPCRQAPPSVAAAVMLPPASLLMSELLLQYQQQQQQGSSALRPAASSAVFPTPPSNAIDAPDGGVAQRQAESATMLDELQMLFGGGGQGCVAARKYPNGVDDAVTTGIFPYNGGLGAEDACGGMMMGGELDCLNVGGGLTNVPPSSGSSLTAGVADLASLLSSYHNL